MKNWNGELDAKLNLLSRIGEVVCDYNFMVGTKVYEELYRDLDKLLWFDVRGILYEELE